MAVCAFMCVCVCVYVHHFCLFQKFMKCRSSKILFLLYFKGTHVFFFFSRISSFFTDLIESLNGQLSQRDGMHLYQRTFVGLV